MRKIYIFEKNCCGPSSYEQLAQFLEQKFGSDSEVKMFDLGRVTGSVPMPVQLLLKIQVEGTACLPALVVDGQIMTERGLPNFFDAVELIQSGKPATNDVSLNKGSSCC